MHNSYTPHKSSSTIDKDTAWFMIPVFTISRLLTRHRHLRFLVIRETVSDSVTNDFKSDIYVSSNSGSDFGTIDVCLKCDSGQVQSRNVCSKMSICGDGGRGFVLFEM